MEEGRKYFEKRFALFVLRSEHSIDLLFQRLTITFWAPSTETPAASIPQNDLADKANLTLLALCHFS